MEQTLLHRYPIEAILETKLMYIYNYRKNIVNDGSKLQT